MLCVVSIILNAFIIFLIQSDDTEAIVDSEDFEDKEETGLKDIKRKLPYKQIKVDPRTTTGRTYKLSKKEKQLAGVKLHAFF